jgi:diguanylate cyclase
MIELLKKTDLFSKLKNDELEVIAENSEYINFPDNGIIFRTGDNALSFYIIKEGEARIISRSENNGGREIAHFIKGELFGELDLFENTDRTSDAIAETDTVLLSFPKKGILFTDILQNHPEICAQIVYKFLALVAGRIRFTNKLVSEKTSWIEDLRKQILYDNLTGLYNRSFLEEDFKAQLHNYGKSTSLLAIKPDNFKTINDSYGHEAGDKALRLLADMIKSRLRSADIAVRYRGDEFMVILPGQDVLQAMPVAEDLLASIFMTDLKSVIDDTKFKFTASIGLADYPFHTNNPESLVKTALEKMFDARNSGGNKVISV